MGDAIAHPIVERRPGDTAILVADSQQANQQLDWQPRYTEIGGIIASAWEFHNATGRLRTEKLDMYPHADTDCCIAHSPTCMPTLDESLYEAYDGPIWAQEGEPVNPISPGDTLFSKTQQRVLGLLYGKPDETFYLNEIGRLANMGKGTIRRELERMQAAGLITLTRIGNQSHYQANANSYLYGELFGAAPFSPLRYWLIEQDGK